MEILNVDEGSEIANDSNFGYDFCGDGGGAVIAIDCVFLEAGKILPRQPQEPRSVRADPTCP